MNVPSKQGTKAISPVLVLAITIYMFTIASDNGDATANLSPFGISRKLIGI